MFYRIWSFEHDAWWNPDREGYTQNKHSAGLYEQREAAEIVESSLGEEIALAEQEQTAPRVIVFSVTYVLAAHEVLS